MAFASTRCRLSSPDYYCPNAGSYVECPQVVIELALPEASKVPKLIIDCVVGPSAVCPWLRRVVGRRYSVGLEGSCKAEYKRKIRYSGH
eukprot:CAMPEP_0204914496 /NCGR_PEP_ID=MMETSP1397-20131031/12371_1 /ASSEMBLY_ACC=CAM_ASM_000891 /TAXON_ID=49980 /ORGANISM="Climacostomum Climacostomum virens, Strain Stock W-24" /LENGTH=88 /DNA_ID=CAMNT_0052086097 /DNA_START=52 /DNA_END=318 /DNA_ORIENTATION=-